MKRFFDTIRPMFGGSMTQSQVDGCMAVYHATDGLHIQERAYLLATAYHETAHTMQPIREYGRGAGRPYGDPGAHRGQIPYGRGYVQLTWDENYEKADRRLGLNGALLRDFSLALDPDIAAEILVRGCLEGWFTGKKLTDYLPGDYVNARRVVNGTDRAERIAGYAETFELALSRVKTPGRKATESVGIAAALVAAAAGLSAWWCSIPILSMTCGG